MKTIATLLRHGITYLVGLMVTWFTLHLAGDELKSASDAANALIEPLVIVLGFVGVILARLAMPFIQKIFQRGAGETDEDSAGGLSPCVLGLCVAAAGLVFPLSSCTSQSQDARWTLPPLRISGTYQGIGLSVETGGQEIHAAK
jgi:uncharacterized protein involved in response to NO